MTECENVTAPWGSTCPDCGQILRAGKPIRSWMAEKYAPEARGLKGALALRDSGKAYRFRLHRTDRRAA